VREFARGAVLVDPTDADAIAAGLNEAMTRRPELAREARKAASGYEWSGVAEMTVDVYREAAA
jgi:glycosyltransferase involved in cell wall biosynthesis